MDYRALYKGKPKPNSVNERLPRYFVEGYPQHVIQRGNNRDVIFVSDTDYIFYLECLAKAAENHSLDIHAYVLMTNHVHLLVTPETEKSLPKTMQSIGRRYVQYFNHTYRRTGTLWEGRYKATIIDSDQYLMACSRYIELNPVRAGMVSSPVEYPWSSYPVNALGKNSEFITPHSNYLALGRDGISCQRAYLSLFDTALTDQQIEDIRGSAHKGWALGDDRFKERVEELSQRRAAPLFRGRPKKVS